MVVMAHWLIWVIWLIWLIGSAPISRELSSIGAGYALRYEILDSRIAYFTVIRHLLIHRLPDGTIKFDLGGLPDSCGSPLYLALTGGLY